jgi:hypothetical protein
MLARRWVSRRGNLSHQGSSATTHALVSRPRKEHLSAQEDGVSTSGRICTCAPTNRVSSSKLSVPASQRMFQLSVKSLEHPYWNTYEEQYPCFHRLYYVLQMWCGGTLCQWLSQEERLEYSRLVQQQCTEPEYTAATA